MSMTLRYDFAGSPSLVAAKGPTLALTRATTASVTDYDNIIKQVASGEARYTGGRRVENLQVQSQTFDNVAWTGNSGSAVSNVGTAPDGTLTADRFDVAVASTTHFIYDGFTITSGQTYTLSVYAKDDGNGYLWISLSTGGSEQFISASYDLITGVVGTTDVGATSGTLTGSGIVDAGNGWYRCWLSGSIAASGYFLIGPAGSATPSWGSNGYASYLGVAGEDILLWGAQLENVSGQADPAPSEYIATTTAAVAQWYPTKRRTNLLLQSEWTSSGSVPTGWGIFGGTGTYTYGVTPTLVTSGKAIRFESSNERTYLVPSIYPVLLANTTYTLSGYVEDATLADGGATLSFSSLSDATGNTSVAAVTGVTGRISCTFTTGLDVAGQPRIGLGVNSNATGDITLSGIQLEEGSTATDYIPTTTTVESSDFDTAITSTGLLVEEARTNIVLQSETFDNVAWTGSSATVDANVGTAPDGTLTMDRINTTVATVPHYIFDAGLAMTANTVVTASCFFKDDGVNFVGVNWWGSAENFISVVADLSIATPAITATDVGTTSGTITASGVEDVGNGIYRVWVTGSITPAVSLSVLLFESDSATPTFNTNGLVSFLGVAGEDALCWGAQVEAGAFPTSYIPTTTASVTRNQDLVATNDVTWFAAVGGTIYCRASLLSDYTINQGLWSLDGGVAARTSEAIMTTTNRLTVFGSGGMVLITANNGIPDSTVVQFANGFEINNSILYTDGVASAADNTVASISTPTDLNVGSRFDGSVSWNGHIAELRYYNTRLTDAQLEDMSNGIFPAGGRPSFPLGMTNSPI